MEELLKYFIKETGEKFAEVKSDLSEINEKLGDLREFKIQMLASARTTSFIVSAICGFITLLATVLAVPWLSGKLGGH
jgi:hypothetical protein